MCIYICIYIYIYIYTYIYIYIYIYIYRAPEVPLELAGKPVPDGMRELRCPSLELDCCYNCLY